jgi:hypothetical protein
MDAGPVATAGDPLAVGTLVNDDPNLAPVSERVIDRLARVSRMVLDGGADARRAGMAGPRAADMMGILVADMDALVLSPGQCSTARAATADDGHGISRRRSPPSVTAPAAV